MRNTLYEESAYQTEKIPGSFVKRRLHSITGLFLVLFLFEHLLTNSQASLLFGEDGGGFIRSVNFIKSLPYLPVIEITLLGVPFLLHGWYGIQYLMTAAPNTLHGDGAKPALPLPRNRAYNWMRITAALLVVGVVAHVVSMRFMSYPEEIRQESYRVIVQNDAGLANVAERLHVLLGSENEKGVEAICPSFGTASLLVVRNAFQSVGMCILYTIFVIAACFHAMNGVWTFAISWGITLTERSRVLVRRFSNVIMALILFLGLIAIWGTFWINLKN